MSTKKSSLRQIPALEMSTLSRQRLAWTCCWCSSSRRLCSAPTILRNVPR
jgi:hypothetical protein